MNNTPDQNYISETLFHFVGRSAENDIDVFEIFKSILSQKELLFDPSSKHPPAVEMFNKSTINELGEISKIPAICFCDIPIEHLSIHINKYSSFGIGFKKNNICHKGARPVWYIPINSYSCINTSERIETRFPNELLRLLESTSVIIKKLTENTDITETNILTEDQELQRSLKILHSGHFFLLAEIAWFFKFYDSTLPDDSPKNYYFEREWRKVNGNLTFTDEDIDCLVVPNLEYKVKLITAFPQYKDIIETLIK